jgi:glutamine amidotransferase-like uncharacterized protein
MNFSGGKTILAGLVLLNFLISGLSAKKINVALYADNGTLPKCIDSTLTIFNREKGFSIQTISSQDIRDGKLDRFDVFLLPGGTASGERKSLGPESCQILTDFIRNGKGLVATCAGAYLAGKDWNPERRDIEVINSEVNDLDNWARGVQMVECEISGSAKKNNGTLFSIFYENGPPLIPSDLTTLPAYTSLARYKTDLHASNAPINQMGGKDAIIAAPFGKGKVLLFSPHPELTPGLQPLLLQGTRWAATPFIKKSEITWESVFGNWVPGGK